MCHGRYSSVEACCYNGMQLVFSDVKYVGPWFPHLERTTNHKLPPVKMNGCLLEKASCLEKILNLKLIQSHVNRYHSTSKQLFFPINLSDHITNSFSNPLPRVALEPCIGWRFVNKEKVLWWLCFQDDCHDVLTDKRSLLSKSYFSHMAVKKTNKH